MKLKTRITNIPVLFHSPVYLHSRVAQIKLNCSWRSCLLLWVFTSLSFLREFFFMMLLMFFHGKTFSSKSLFECMNSSRIGLRRPPRSVLIFLCFASASLAWIEAEVIFYPSFIFSKYEYKGKKMENYASFSEKGWDSLVYKETEIFWFSSTFFRFRQCRTSSSINLVLIAVSFGSDRPGSSASLGSFSFRTL